jgi:hypothetical protein
LYIAGRFTPLFPKGKYFVNDSFGGGSWAKGIVKLGRAFVPGIAGAGFETKTVGKRAAQIRDRRKVQLFIGKRKIIFRVKIRLKRNTGQIGKIGNGNRNKVGNRNRKKVGYRKS